MFPGRSEAKRLKSTSEGVWSREEVSVKTLSGEKVGRVEIRAKVAATKRMLMA